MWRPRRRAMSCSSSRRSSRSFMGLLTSARPASFIESYSTKSPASPVVLRPSVSTRPASYIEPHSSSSSSPLICRAAASECILPGAVGPMSPIDLSTRNSPVMHVLQRSTFCSTNISVISEHPAEFNQILSIVNKSINSISSSSNDQDSECVDSEGKYDVVVQSIYDAYHDTPLTHSVDQNSQSTNDCAIQTEKFNFPNYSPNKQKGINVRNTRHSFSDNAIKNTTAIIDSSQAFPALQTDDEGNLNTSIVNAQELEINFKNTSAQQISFSKNRNGSESCENNTKQGPTQPLCEEGLTNNVNVDTTSKQSVIKSVDVSQSSTEATHKQIGTDKSKTGITTNTTPHLENTSNYNAPACVITLATSPAQVNSKELMNISSENTPELSCSISIPELSCSPSSSSSILIGEHSIAYQAMQTPETSPTLSLASPNSSLSSSSIFSETSAKTFNSSSTFPPSIASSPVHSECTSNHQESSTL